MVEKRLVFKWSEIQSLTIWNLHKWSLFCQKPFEIQTVPLFQMFGAIAIAWLFESCTIWNLIFKTQDFYDWIPDPLHTCFNFFYRTTRDIFKYVLQFSRNTRSGENDLHRSLESDVVKNVIRERMPRCIADNMFAILSNFGTADPQLVQNLSGFLQETVRRVEQQRHMGDKTGHLTTLLNKLLSNLNWFKAAFTQGTFQYWKKVLANPF